MDADRVAHRALELHEKASMPLSEALALAVREAAPGSIWPCAKLVIRDGLVSLQSHQYAPGLPDGEHDVYPLPVDSDADPVAGVIRTPALTARDVELLREIRVNFNDLAKLSADWRNEARNLLLRIEQGTAGVKASGLPAWVDGLRDFMERNGKTTEEIGNVLVAAGFATHGVAIPLAAQPSEGSDA